MTTLAFVAGMIPLVVTQRRRLGDQSRDRLGGDRRPDESPQSARAILGGEDEATAQRSHAGPRSILVLPAALRPIATVTGDSVNYGIDADGAGCHDLLGTRCDPYVHKMLTGEELDVCCHSNLLRAVAPYRLSECDVHDVLNIFQVTGLTADTHQYFVKPCPARTGDYFEFFAEIDLLCAISTCPHGDMSVPTWGTNTAGARPMCRPIAIETHSVRPELLRTWSAPPVRLSRPARLLTTADAGALRLRRLANASACYTFDITRETPCLSDPPRSG